MGTTTEHIRQAIESSEWVSIATEIRPSIVKTPDGNIKPLFCSREFLYPGNDKFTLAFMNYADPYGKVPLAKMLIKGHIRFGNPHPIAEGAYELDYMADEGFEITVLYPGLVNALNAVPASDDVGKWELGVPKDVLNKTVLAFGLKSGEFFTEYDLIYVYDNLLFNGSRNIDGRAFDKPENRPTNLQVPLIRKAA